MISIPYSSPHPLNRLVRFHANELNVLLIWDIAYMGYCHFVDMPIIIVCFLV